MYISSNISDLKYIKDIINSYSLNRILVVCGKNSYIRSGAQETIERELKNYSLTYYNDFEVNPKIEDAIDGAKLAIEKKIEIIICIGGGSVIDMAKLIKAFFNQVSYSNEIVKNEVLIKDPDIPLIAVPTTAGSGSESTHFAVVYIKDRKYSLADSCLIPQKIILDGSLTLSASRYQKACNVLDAYSQSIESAWALNSTRESRDLSLKALRKITLNFDKYVNLDNDLASAQAMIEAANLAGQAINIAKTTAAHAWSYGLTSKYNIPHGHAVWLTLPKIFEIHFLHSSKNKDSNNEYATLNNTMKKLIEIMQINNNDFEKYFKNILNLIGIKSDIKNDFKISHEERVSLSKNVNSERLANNPIVFSKFDIDQIFKI